LWKRLVVDATVVASSSEWYMREEAVVRVCAAVEIAVRAVRHMLTPPSSSSSTPVGFFTPVEVGGI
jgi:hypothetical protein